MSLRNRGRAIPVPGVAEVSSYLDGTYVPFSRPESYITWKDDELTYDMDSEDELWLNKFNIENGFNDPISADALELIISSFEKSLLCVQDIHVDVKAGADPCISLERSQVLEAVHSYWIKKQKRKQKRLAEVKVFQCYQPRNTKGLTNEALPKKRSFYRQASKNGRGKRRTLAAKRYNVDAQKNILQVKEASAASNRLDDLAVSKRNRAQLLMEVADQSTYKATIALRISEALKSLAD